MEKPQRYNVGYGECYGAGVGDEKVTGKILKFPPLALANAIREVQPLLDRLQACEPFPPPGQPIVITQCPTKHNATKPEDFVTVTIEYDDYQRALREFLKPLKTKKVKQAMKELGIEC